MGMIQRIVLVFCALTLAQCSYSSNQHHGFAVIENGESSVNIVTDINADEQIQNAALILQSYIEESTGVRLNIVTGEQSENYIYLGLAESDTSDRVNLSGDGFILSTSDNKIEILGGSAWGVEYGVYSFLERFVGVKWLMPTKDWTVVPKLSVLKIPIGDTIEDPKFISRRLAPLNENGDLDQDVWGRRNRLRNNIEFNHNLFRIFSASELGRNNRNVFPLLNNERYIPTDKNDQKWQPNFSDPKTTDVAVKYINSYFAKNPQKKSFSLGINDSKRFDESSESSKRNYLGEEDRSNEYYKWVNEVVRKSNEKFPDKYYGLLAYNNTFDPPSFQIEDNIIPFITYERFKWVDSQLEKEGKEITKNWTKVSPNVGWYDYNYGFNYYLPKVWFHHLKDYLLWGNENGIRYYVAEFYPNWGEGPKGWLTAKLLWNPDQDVDALLKEWYDAAFGETAGAKVSEYYSIWENFWTTEIPLSAWWSKKGQYLPFNNFDYLQNVPDSYIANSDKLLKEALELVQNEDQRKRLNDIIKMWTFYKSAVLLYNNNENVILQDSGQDMELTTKSNVSTTDVFSSHQTFNNLLEEFKSDDLFLFTADYYTRSGSSHSSMKNIGLKTILNNNLSFEKSSNSLILNSSFENDKTPWGTWISKNTTGSFNLSKNNANEGDYSMYAFNIQTGSLYQDFDYTNGDFLVSINYFIPKQSESAGVKVGLRIYDRDKKLIKNLSESSEMDIPTEYGKWKKATLSFKVEPESPRKASFIRLIINLENIDEIYFDDITTTKVNY